MAPDTIRIEGDLLLSPHAAASALDIVMTRFYRLVREGDLPQERHTLGGHRKYVRKSKIEAYRKRRDHWLRLHGRKK